ncbi:MAG: hypothetical protein HPY74_15325 [Firmicutes bacterium]|nr:hypothetical protein [Bacillota bacterium]
MKKECIKLPFVVPPIITYSTISFPLAVILTDNKTLDWFYSNYINLLSTYDSSQSDSVKKSFKSYALNFIGGDSFGGVPFIEYKANRKSLLIVNLNFAQKI